MHSVRIHSYVFGRAPASQPPAEPLWQLLGLRLHRGRCARARRKRCLNPTVCALRSAFCLVFYLAFHLVCHLSYAAPALGQEQDTPAVDGSDRASAKRAFDEGIAAAHVGNWDEAATAFETAYILYPRALTLLNLAGAQAQLGRLVEAKASYERFLEDASDETKTRYEEVARKELAKVDRRIAHVQPMIIGMEERDVLSIDDAPVDPEQSIALDPGTHRWRLRREGFADKKSALRLGEGEQRDLIIDARREIAWSPIAPIAPSSVGAQSPLQPPPHASGTKQLDDGHRKRGWRSPILWTAVALAVAGGVTAAIVLSQRSSDEPSGYNGNAGVIEVR